jgi:hypothetical protein
MRRPAEEIYAAAALVREHSFNWGQLYLYGITPSRVSSFSDSRAPDRQIFLQTLLPASPALVFARIRQEDRNHRRGLFQDRKLHLLQQAFTDYGGFQCGIYTEVKS